MRRRQAFGMLVIASLVMLAGASVAVAQTEQTDNGAAPQPLGPCPTSACPATPPTLITGTLGSCGDWPQCTSGTQTGRLNRNGVGSTCAVPKMCDIFLNDPGRAFDAYTINNGTGATACVTAELTVLTQTGCNLQMNAYLNTYDPVNICEPQSDYLADPGFSSGSPPSPTSFCADVPAGDNMILVVHTTNPGEIGCDYEVRLFGDCIPVELMDFNVLDN